MSRPSRNTDQKLIDAGFNLIPRFGLSGLSVRKVAQAAKVNLGMFHYYFKSKNEFERRLLEKFYEDFFHRFSLQSSLGRTPLEKLRNALIALAKFGRDHRTIFLVLLKDVLQGHSPTIRFAKKNMPRHVSIIMDLIEDSQKQGLVKKISKVRLLPYIMGAVAVPNLVIGIMELSDARSPFGVPLRIFKESVTSDRAIEERIDLVLKSLLIR